MGKRVVLEVTGTRLARHLPAAEPPVQLPTANGLAQCLPARRRQLQSYCSESQVGNQTTTQVSTCTPQVMAYPMMEFAWTLWVDGLVVVAPLTRAFGQESEYIFIPSDFPKVNSSDRLSHPVQTPLIFLDGG